MKCPHCGAQMKDEQVFCEKCGKERQLVPVFDAEIEAKLESTISGIADDLANTKEIKPLTIYSELKAQQENQQLNKENDDEKSNQPESSDKKEDETDKEDDSDPDEHKSIHHPVIWVVCGILTVLILVFLLVFFVYRSNVSSYEFQLKKAEEMYQAGDYEQMLEYAKEASRMAANSSDAKMMMARAYEGLDKPDMEKQMLIELLSTDHAYAAAYDLLIPMYDEDKNYDAIGTLLSECKEQSVLDKYVDYLSDAPQFDEEGGLYEDVLSLKIIAVGSGNIYYTIDGTDPDTNSLHYLTPIVLNKGAYIVKAIYINPYGIKSEISESRYYIDVSNMAAPYVELASGSYYQPQMIKVEIPDSSYQVYYTTDGSDPNFESMQYTKPIPMPLGKSDFAFIMYDDKDTASDITNVHYDLELELTLTDEQARNMLIQNLIVNNKLLDAMGHAQSIDGVRQYEMVSVIMSSETPYYLFQEIFVSNDGDSQKTGELYSVNIQTGESFGAVEDDDGNYTMHKIE